MAGAPALLRPVPRQPGFGMARRLRRLPAAADRGSSSKRDHPGPRSRQQPRLRLRPRCQHGPTGPRPPAQPFLPRLRPHLPPEAHLEQRRRHLLHDGRLAADHVRGGQAVGRAGRQPERHPVLHRARLAAVVRGSQIPRPLLERHLDPLCSGSEGRQGDVLPQL